MSQYKIEWIINPKNARNTTSADGRWSITCLYGTKYELYDVRERTVTGVYDGQHLVKCAAEKEK